MLFFDVTKVRNHTHRSGIVRVSQQLRHEMSRLAGNGLIEVAWNDRQGRFVSASRNLPIQPTPADWLVTPELFSEEERPGISEWLGARPCRAAAVYYDAIPLQFPEFTWPHSVARHPFYLKLLARFDLVMAISRASAREVLGYWEWLGINTPELITLPLGANGTGTMRARLDPNHAQRRSALMVGILEPRKNQLAVLEAAEALWRDGLDFPLTFVGRMNPHFGKPIHDRIREARRAGRPVKHVSGLDDAGVQALLRETRFVLMPSLAEGCGLPVLEALWSGVPVIGSEVEALRESMAGGGCRAVPIGDRAALQEAMRELLCDDAMVCRLASEAAERPLPTWRDTAEAALMALQ